MIENFVLFAEGISIPELEKLRASYSGGHDARTLLINHIRSKTQNNKKFPLPGCIEEIGSAFDGSKVGQLDEIDTLYVLASNKVTVTCDETAISNIHVAWEGEERSARQFSEFFAEELEAAINESPPMGFEHNGYAAPRFSGIRVNGPAITILFRTAANFGNIAHGTMISVDITLAVRFCHPQCNVIHSWAKMYIIETNKGKAINIGDPHLIACQIQNIWKPTTAFIEASVLHDLNEKSPVKRGHVLLKCLAKKVDSFNSAHGVLEIQENNSMHNELIMQVSRSKELLDISKLNQCMRYGHIWLSATERECYNELGKKNISINTAATKHLLIGKAGPDDFLFQRQAEGLSLRLMERVICEIAKEASLSVTHCIHRDFPEICKLSAREILGDRICGLAKNILHQYKILHKALFTDVSIMWIRIQHHRHFVFSLLSQLYLVC